MKIMKILKSIELKNFKNHERLSVQFDEKTEIYGQNGKGKSAVGQAIDFIMKPKKTDTDKIRTGAHLCEVSLDLLVEGNEHNITVRLDRNENLKTSMTQNGELKPFSKSFVASLMTSFILDPREILDKTKRQDNILKLLPLQVTKEMVKGLSIDDHSIDYNDHGVNILVNLEKSIRSQKREAYTEHKTHKGYVEKHREAFNLRKSNYTDKTGGEIPTDEFQKDGEKAISSLGFLNAQIESIKTTMKNIEISKEEQNKNRDSIEFQIKSLRDKIQEINIQTTQAADELYSLDQKLVEAETSKEVVEKKAEIYQKQKENFEDYKSLQIDEKNLKEFEKKLEDADVRHNHIAAVLKSGLPSLKTQLLSPIKKYVEGLDVDEAGGLTYQGAPINQISDSEIIDVAIDIVSYVNKARFIKIDQAECMDSAKLSSLESRFGGQILLFRVSDKPMGGDWKSVKLGGNNE